MTDLKKYVNYEDFGAVGDGETDDTAAIVAAHAYANEHKLPVKTKHDAHYYIGPKAMPAYIETDVDWNTTRFTIDDRAVEDNKTPCFIVRSTLPQETIHIEKLSRDQKQLDVHPTNDCVVTVYNDNVRHFRRLGLNQSDGYPARDTFVLRRDGSTYGPIDWNHDTITSVEARPIDDTVLTLKGGVFTTIANRDASTYDYYERNIEIQRSNTTIDGIIHHVAGEISHGAPYTGFISCVNLAFITIQNCFFTGHKIFWTIGAANLPVPMGSYDLNANSVVDYTCKNCKINGITDNTRWGIIGSNFCKNMVVEDCIFSRLDAHMGVSGKYVIRNSQMGHQGLNAIGRGEMIVENTTVYGHNLICFRDDYGSNWEGTVTVKNCTWVPNCGRECEPKLFGITNSGMHDFGYPCHMPESFTIENLHVEDSNTPANYEGLQLFSDPEAPVAGANIVISDPRPFPYKPSESVTITGLTCASGKPVHIGPAAKLLKDAVITVNGEKLN
ncbi:MAG: hypothetical protein IKU17_02635 [Clostridia bacterium]|nr:hypothetical protein [Clostridia bacterium]